MKHLFHALLLVVLFPAYNKAQSVYQRITSSSSVHPMEESICPAKDGGYFMAGVDYHYEQVLDDKTFQGIIVKLNSSGHLVWGRSIGNVYDEVFSDVTATADGGVVACGSAGHPYYDYTADVLVVKLDANGNLLWSKILKAPDENESAHSIIEDADGNFVVCGLAFNQYELPTDVFICKLNPKGALLWSYKYPFSGTINAYSYDIIQAADGNYVLAGDIFYTDTSKSDVLLMKIKKSGGVLWCKSYGTTNTRENGTRLIKTNTSGFAIVGTTNYFTNSLIKYDLLVLITDSTGNLVNTNVVSTNDHDFSFGGMCKAIATDKGFFVSGTSVGGTPDQLPFIMKFDDNGKKLWARKWKETVNPDNEIFPGSIIENSDKSLMVGGFTTIQPAGMFYSRLSANGNSCAGRAYTTFHDSYTLLTSVVNTTRKTYATDSAAVLAVSSFMGDSTLCSVAEPLADLIEPGSINATSLLSATLFPNPAQNVLMVNINAAVPYNSLVTVTGKNGKQYIAKTEKIQAGKNLIRLDVSALPAGMYLLNIQTGGNNTGLKFLKE